MMINNLESKKDYQELLMKIIEPLANRFSAGCARINLDGGGATYPQDVIELEAFARPLWGLIPFWIGGGQSAEFEKKYLEGLSNGTDPKHEEYWGDCGNNDQRFVEMTPIAFGLLTIPHILWSPLTEAAKHNLAKWLYQINEHEIPHCNWYYFRVFVNIALKSLDCDYSQKRLDEDMEFIEGCYKGNGWYEDGVSTRTDYYSAFAMQFYSILYSIYGDGNKKQATERANLFSTTFMLWFSKSGAPLPYGRSLIYRFATSSFFSALAVVDDTADYGVLKGIINRNIRYFLSKDTVTGDGILSVGYLYPNLTMAERYNAPGSPYWCLKTFLILALPDSHAYWNAKEKELPISDGIYNIDDARMLISRKDIDVWAFVPGMIGMKSLGHFTEKYDKFVYSTAFPFSISHSNETIDESAADNMLAFEIDGYVYVRRGSQEYRIDGNTIYSKWTVPNVEVETTIVILPNGHIRKHRITSRIRCRIYDTGFSIEYNRAFQVHNHGNRIDISNNEYVSGIESHSANCALSYIKASPNSNIAYKNSIFPVATYEIDEGNTYIEDVFIGSEVSVEKRNS